MLLEAIAFYYVALSGTVINGTVNNFSGDKPAPFLYINKGNRTFARDKKLAGIFKESDNQLLSHDVRVFQIDEKKYAIIQNTYKSKKSGGLTKFLICDKKNCKSLVNLIGSHGGFGETILFADFDNDGYNDFVLPGYAIEGVSDCTKVYKNIEGSRFDSEYFKSNWNEECPFSSFWQPEGGVVFDYLDNGLVDFLINSNIFVNDDKKNFVRLGSNIGIDDQFDEGISLIDFNNDGNLDLLFFHPKNGLSLYKSDGIKYTKKNDIFKNYTHGSDQFGFTVVDLNSDGFEDIVLSLGMDRKSTTVLINRKGEYFEGKIINFNGKYTRGIQHPAVADFDGDGAEDLFFPGKKPFVAFNKTMPSFGSIKVGVFGKDKQMNMAGRVVRVEGENSIQTRVVNGGGGYITQNDYILTIPLAEVGNKRVKVSPLEFGSSSIDVVLPPNYKLDIIKNIDDNCPDVIVYPANNAGSWGFLSEIRGFDGSNSIYVSKGLIKVNLSRGQNSVFFDKNYLNGVADVQLENFNPENDSIFFKNFYGLNFAVINEGGFYNTVVTNDDELIAVIKTDTDIVSNIVIYQ